MRALRGRMRVVGSLREQQHVPVSWILDYLQMAILAKKENRQPKTKKKSVFPIQTAPDQTKSHFPSINFRGEGSKGGVSCNLTADAVAVLCKSAGKTRDIKVLFLKIQQRNNTVWGLCRCKLYI